VRKRNALKANISPAQAVEAAAHPVESLDSRFKPFTACWRLKEKIKV
jgi:hypothetical protein